MMTYLAIPPWRITRAPDDFGFSISDFGLRRDDLFACLRNSSASGLFNPKSKIPSVCPSF
jgi:hypothetical protein